MGIEKKGANYADAGTTIHNFDRLGAVTWVDNSITRTIAFSLHRKIRRGVASAREVKTRAVFSVSMLLQSAHGRSCFWEYMRGLKTAPAVDPAKIKRLTAEFDVACIAPVSGCPQEYAFLTGEGAWHSTSELILADGGIHPALLEFALLNCPEITSYEAQGRKKGQSMIVFCPDEEDDRSTAAEDEDYEEAEVVVSGRKRKQRSISPAARSLPRRRSAPVIDRDDDDDDVEAASDVTNENSGGAPSRTKDVFFAAHYSIIMSAIQASIDRGAIGRAIRHYTADAMRREFSRWDEEFNANVNERASSLVAVTLQPHKREIDSVRSLLDRLQKRSTRS